MPGRSASGSCGSRSPTKTTKDLLKNGGLAYVLGGQTKSWELSGAAAGKTLTIKAESDTGPINASAFAGRSG